MKTLLGGVVLGHLQGGVQSLQRLFVEGKEFPLHATGHGSDAVDGGVSNKEDGVGGELDELLVVFLGEESDKFGMG